MIAVVEKDIREFTEDKNEVLIRSSLRLAFGELNAMEDRVRIKHRKNHSESSLRNQSNTTN